MNVLAQALLAAWLSQAAPQGVEQLAFLAGAWGSAAGGIETEEHWTTPRAGSLLGMNRTVKAGKTVAFEFLRIEARPDGVYYLASPGGQPATPFKLKESGKDKVVFENLEHDFPQRVSYWLDGASLCAKIEGTQKGKPAARQWCWQPLR